MADEAVTTIVLRMRDEASGHMEGLGQNIQNTEMQAFQLNLTLTAVGGALSAMGALIGQLDTPMAKMASTFLTTGGAILMTTSAIMLMIPHIKDLIIWLRGLAIAQALVQALAGPPGWVTLGIGLAVAGAAAAGIVAMTGGFGRGGGGGGGTTVNINTAAVMGNEAQARDLARKIKRFSDEDTRLGR